MSKSPPAISGTSGHKVPEGRRFKPGQSGNPSGRKPVPPEVREALEKLTPRAVAVLAELLHADDEKVRLQAANTVLDRNLGKPVQPIEHGAGDLGSLDEALALLPEAIKVLKQSK